MRDNIRQCDHKRGFWKDHGSRFIMVLLAVTSFYAGMNWQLYLVQKKVHLAAEIQAREQAAMDKQIKKLATNYSLLTEQISDIATQLDTLTKEKTNGQN